MKLVWSPRAVRQLEDAVAYIEQDNPRAAWDLHDRILETAEKLLTSPELGPTGPRPGTRELTITRTRYVLVYRVTLDSIQIAAVWHTRQNRKRR